MIRFCLIVLLTATCDFAQGQPGDIISHRMRLYDEIEHSLKTELLEKWYPLCIDKEYGGFLSTFTYDFKPTGPQDKMIVTQARHTWTNTNAAVHYPLTKHYKEGARHGFEFLKNVMWDKTYGGFYQLVDRQGNVKGGDQKTAYGNAFAIYALAAYYQLSKDKDALQLAKDGFAWLEKHSHDPIYKGYFQHLQRDGTPVKRSDNTPSTSDLGYKDQNSSIHLLEAFTELYDVWKDPLLRERLQEMLSLIRDKIVNDKGSLVLFFQPDWTPVSFADSSRESILRHRYLDHVSFGHDVETAYLLLDAERSLKSKDPKTATIAKRMVDHSLKKGWDKNNGGFYDQGYYFKNDPDITIIKASKNWWAQAEGLNTLLLMADLYPKDTAAYYNYFRKMWSYINIYIIDHVNGDWYEEGIDHDPQRKTALKGHIWKATYHQYRALTAVMNRLRRSNSNMH
jgi:mannobiose 2-epimerase